MPNTGMGSKATTANITVVLTPVFLCTLENIKARKQTHWTHCRMTTSIKHMFQAQSLQLIEDHIHKQQKIWHCLHCPSAAGFNTGMNTDSREAGRYYSDFQSYTRDGGFKAKKIGRQQHRGLTGSPCETKQSTSCSVKPGRSFWQQFGLGTSQQRWETERASRGTRCDSAQTYTLMCTLHINAWF